MGRCYARRLGQPVGIAAAKLQGERVFCRVMTKQPLDITMQNGLSRHHLGEQQRIRREQTMEKTTMPVCPIHHRRHR